jgi:hypothetical protein
LTDAMPEPAMTPPAPTRDGGAPSPIVNMTPPLPTTETSCGPDAPPPPSPASDGRPVAIRVCAPWRTWVIAPVAPRQTSAGSLFSKHGPLPPRPASAT